MSSRLKDMNVEKFKTFLEKSGAEMLPLTNQHEVIRFKTPQGLSVVYKSKRGYTLTNEAGKAHNTMKCSGVWKVRTRKEEAKHIVKNELLKRDGTECFYCGKKTSKDDRTIEHILSVASGGNNNIANLAVSCISCNKKAGSMHIVDKIKMRDNLRNQQQEGKTHDSKDQPSEA